jgi:non-canonical (house-cleaning) NTP pyrophosphatase
VDISVGIESGLFVVFGVELDIQVCSVFDGPGTRSDFSQIPCPMSVLNQITAERKIGHIKEWLFGINA